MSSTTLVRDRIKKNLQFINDTFVDADVQNNYLGKNAVTTNPFTNLLINYNDFKKNFGAFGATDISTINVKAKSSTTSIWAKLSQNTPLVIRGDSIKTKDNTSFEEEYDINFKDVTFINNSGKKPDEFNNVTVLELLNRFTYVYNLLDTSKFKDYKAGEEVTISNYSGDTLTIQKGTNISFPDILDNTILKISNLVTDTSTTRIDAVRRLFLGYIYLIEVYIALYMYENDTTAVANTTGTNPDYTTKNILETCIKKFIKLNLKMYDSATDAGIGKLYTELSNRMTSYRENVKELNVLNTELNDTKTEITLEKNSINSHTSFLQHNQTAFYLYTIIFITLVIVLLYTYYSPIGAAARQKIMALIAGVSMVILVVVFLTYKFVIIEPFAVPEGTQITLYSDIVLEVFNQFLVETINVLRVLDSYRSYGEISKSINKEKNFYSNIVQELKLNKGELNSVQAERLRQGKILRYRTYLFIQILITISFLMLLLSYQYNILYIIIAAFVILVWVYLYVFNMNNLVRTDAKKFYWGQPTMD